MTDRHIQGQLTPQSRVKSGSNSNSSKMLWLSLLLPKMKKIRSKLKALERPQYKILIFQTLKAANSAVRGRIWSKFELIKDVMDVLVTSKNKEDPIWPKFELIRDIVVILVTSKNEEDPLKNNDARVATTQNMDFPDAQGQITPQSEVGSGRNLNSSKMLWMSLLLPRIKKIRIKMKAQEWPQH